MKRALPTLCLVFLFLFAFAPRLRAQTQALAATPSATSFRRSSTTPSDARHAYGEKLHLRGVPNFGKVNDHLYRGAQPRDAGLLELKELGITTIVDLRAEDPAKSRQEEEKAEALGMRFVEIPVGGWSPPADSQVAQFLAIFRDRPQEKVFVHCHLGEDRTGVFIASYRMAFDKAPPDQALKEMYYFGFNGFWHPSMASFVQKFPGRLASDPPLAPFKNIE
jgi:protein tyrosine phosphatase (PTP) superfamily phosphohydrolase (DUF442 family)